MTKKYDDEGNDIEDVETTYDDSEQEEDEQTTEGEAEEKKEETVSLSKYMALKKKLKEKEEGGSSLSDEDRELLASIREEKKIGKLKSAYDSEFGKLAERYPALKNKSEQIFKLSMVDGNEEKTLEEIALDTFAGFIEKPSSEDDSRGGDVDVSNVDFSKMNDVQLKEVMNDPKAKAAYYKYADGVG